MNSAPDRVSADLRAANVADPHAILPTPPKTEPVHDASDESIMWMSESALLEPSSRPGNKGDRTTGAHGSASMVNLYLLAYNVSLTVGWAVILIRIVSHLAAGGSLATVYPLVRELLVVCQTAALMEIVHALAKLVRSPVGTTAIQVASRILVLYGALELGSPAVTEGSWATQTIAAWSMAEVLRYSYYAVGLLAKDSIPRFMTWLRYSGFLVLYPMGITGEMLCMYAALPFVAKAKPYTLTMPNWYNFSFDYYSFIWFTLLGLYPPGAYVMYTYMMAQRRKTLGKKKAE